MFVVDKRFMPTKRGPADEELAAAIVARCAAPTAEALATTIGTMVRRDELAHGDRLPTVRVLARAAGISSSTVADAWRILQQHGIIETARRNGTTIRAARAEMTGRFWRVPATAGPDVLDLSTGTPDTDLLPSMSTMLDGLDGDIEISSYIDRHVLAELEEVLRTRAPFVPEALTVLNGSLDALDRLIAELVGFGDLVVVEDPTFPPILDMLERAGAEIVGVELDDHGVRPDRLAEALRRRPAVALLQPNAHNPTGRSMTPERMDRVAELFAELAPDTWIIEDHHAGDLAGASAPSLGARLPHRVVHIHSFSKTLGPDLRVAAVLGAREPIRSVIDRRRLGPGWTSRLLQRVLLGLLLDPRTDELVTRAADEYARRSGALRDELAGRGIEVAPCSGLNLWVPVANEQRAVLALALAGIGVAPGSPFRIDGSTVPDHIRVSIGNLRDDAVDVAAAIAEAAAP